MILNRFGQMLALMAIVTAGCSPSNAASDSKHFHPKGKPPSEHTIAVLKQAKTGLPFADKRDFEEAKKGFIAAPESKKIMAAGRWACSANA